MPGKNAFITTCRALWRAVAPYQNHDFFHRTGSATLAPASELTARLPVGLDLRASGPGFANVPVRLRFTDQGDAYLVLNENTIPLGNIAAQTVETGWMVTGLRLRGAVRFTERKVVLLVPDREDIPYLLRALTSVPSAEQHGYKPLFAAA